MQPRARYNDKARASGLAKQRAIREARKHGRHDGSADGAEEGRPGKRRRKRDKYVENKLRSDEKAKYLNLLARSSNDTPPVGEEGRPLYATSKALKRDDKRQGRDADRQGFDEEFGGFSESDDDSEPNATAAVPTPDAVSASASQPSSKSFGFGFGFGADPSAAAQGKAPGGRQAARAKPKYTWRALLEQKKLQKAGLAEDEDTTDDGDDTDDTDEGNESEDDDDDDKGIQRQIVKAGAGSGASMPGGGHKSTGGEDVAMREPRNNAVETSEQVRAAFAARERSVTPEPADLGDLTPPSLKANLITRTEEISSQRAQLPAFGREQEVVEMVKRHSVVVLTGATGSGKTTQVPQFLYEAGFKGIGVTQPRRVAAVSMARRVGEELGDHGKVVAHQIRFDSNVKPGTQVKFMTDGILLREMSIDLLLPKYEVVIIDEAHERSTNTDILIGLLSRVVRLRRERGSPLRLVIMSATLRVTDFVDNKRLFAAPPPVFAIEARQFPVSSHFSRRTVLGDYVDEAADKVVRIHKKLPRGDILVFLTSQAEIFQCIKTLRERLGLQVKSAPQQVRLKAEMETVETEEVDATIDATKDEEDEDRDDFEDDHSDASDVSDIEETEQDKADSKEDKIMRHVGILPLYSLLPAHEQMKIFSPTPKQTRRIIVATNVAETSLTIPGVRYVVDCGRAKFKRYDGRLQRFEVDWVSKASADQRAGRAGRTGPGHAYRLFSSAVFDARFPPFGEAEIQTAPVDGIVLNMKAMNIHTVSNFPFPTPPDRLALAQAEKALALLGALDGKSHITDLGRQMALLPISPRFAKMLVLGNQGGLLPYAVAIVAGMSAAEDPFERLESIEARRDANAPDADGATDEGEARRRRRLAYNSVLKKFSTLDQESDVMRLLGAVCAYDYAPDEAAFCREHYLRPKAMSEIRQLRVQLNNVLRSATDAKISDVLRLRPPTGQQVELLHQLIACCFLDQIAIRADLLPTEASVDTRNVTRTPYVTLAPTDGYAYVHPACYNIRTCAYAPEYVIYRDLSTASATKIDGLSDGGAGHASRVRMQVLCKIEAGNIASLVDAAALSQDDAPSLVTYGKPLDYPPARDYTHNGALCREVTVRPSLQLPGSGKRPWPLPPRRLHQRFGKDRTWRFCAAPEL